MNLENSEKFVDEYGVPSHQLKEDPSGDPGFRGMARILKRDGEPFADKSGVPGRNDERVHFILVYDKELGQPPDMLYLSGCRDSELTWLAEYFRDNPYDRDNPINIGIVRALVKLIRLIPSGEKRLGMLKDAVAQAVADTTNQTELGI